MIDRPRLVSFICCAILSGSGHASAEHRDTWVEIRSPHFTVISNAGESEGRAAAQQFEQVRTLFSDLYPAQRVDSGKPTVVFAIKNEESFKLFVPDYGQNSKAMRLDGFYRTAYDKNFAIVRADARGPGPLGYRTLYHEYTHAFFRYNYRGLPVWLDEGLAEFYGNTDITSSQASVGLANATQLRLLKANKLLPIDQLVTIDRTSPLYNTREHSGIFYAESWALVHYLTISRDMRDQHLITKYLDALHNTDDPIEAARETFGDLQKLSEKLESYVRRLSFSYVGMPLNSKLSQKEFPSHLLSPADGLLAQADYLLRTSHLPEGLERLHEIEQLASSTPALHSEFGLYHLAKADYANAEKELQLAIAADPNDISAHIDQAFVYLRRDGYTKASTPKIRGELETVIRLNPDFAPAHAFLSIAYAQEPDRDVNKALKAAVRASELEPGSMAYFIDIGKALLAADRISEAKKIANVAQKVATTSGDRATATNFQKQIDAKVSHKADKAAPVEAVVSGTEPGTAESADSLLHAEGQITELLCGHPPEVLLTLTTNSDSLLLHVADVARIAIQEGGGASDAAHSPCSKWKDRHVKLDYRAIASGLTKGDIQAISLE